jgi:fructose-specific phosphotransferase system IIC component
MATTFGTGSLGEGKGLPRQVVIPSGIVNADLMSKTSLASDCFIKQKFSNKLQSYLIGYVNSIYSDYPVFK